MNNEELKQAMIDETPVAYKDYLLGEIVHDKISGIILRKGKNGKIVVSIELSDKNQHSTILCRPSQVCMPTESQVKEAQSA